MDRWDNIAYMWTNGILKTLPDSFTDNISPSKFNKKAKLILKHVTADLLRFFKKEQIPKNKIWFLVLTKNNYDSLKDVQLLTDHSIMISFFRFRSTINKSTHYYNLRFRILWDLIYPIAWLSYFVKNPKKAMKYYDLLLTVNGSYEESKRLIKKSTPKGIVFTNDHLVESRSMLLAAKKLGVPTYYIPHASISSFFPPLQFDYALLDGQDTLDKYRSCGVVDSKVELLGMPKFDKYVNNENTNDTVGSIGIAYNMIDEIDDVVALTKKIAESFPEISITLRPHPGDSRKLDAVPKNVKVSDSKKEVAFSFLNKIDLLIAGESSIHLEAVLYNVYPLYFCFTAHNRYDYYGYIKNGLVENLDSQTALLDKISELQHFKPDIRTRAKYYNAAIGTDFYGKTSKRMADLIERTSISI
ncbi:hypothetical protein [Flagellimonas sp.]|uniref:hypothetical protein n=1 Tax=Flagellimonas sp. TaxID=2058762 RepID=UPI003BA96E9F